MTLYKNIAVAVDFSEQSLKAVEHAKNLALDYNAKLTLVSVVDTHTFGTVEAYDVKYADQLKNDYEKDLQTLKEKLLKEQQLEIETVVEQGAAKKILINLQGVDLVVCGATGKSKTEQVILGSISQAILRYSKCDVLIVR